MTALPFPGRTPAVAATRCLNARHTGAGCTRCVTACPTDAIQLEAGQPALDDGACVACGICLHACPTEVFEQVSSPEGTLIQVGEQLPSQPLAVACSLHSTPEITAAPVATIVQHRRCLAALSPSDLLQLSQLGERPLWLDDSECATCPIAQAQATLAANAAVARTLLDAYGQPPAVYLLGEQPDAQVQPPQRRPLFDGGQPKLSRRGLFDHLRTRAVERARSNVLPAAAAAAASAVPVTQRLPQRVPAARQRLLELLASLAPAPEQTMPAGDVPFATVQVDGTRCSGCGLCARFCPTGALDFATEEETFRLRFQPAICLDCTICVVACPEDAVQLGARVNTRDLAVQASALLVEGILTGCVDCGAPTAHPGDDGQPVRCYSCRQGAGVVRSLRDEAGLMADLLQRIPGVGQLPGNLYENDDFAGRKPKPRVKV
jgi:ferredoxin